MKRWSRSLPAVVALALVAACGGVGDDVVGGPEVTVSGVDDTTGGDAAAAPVAELLTAFANLGEGEAFRVTTASGQTNINPALGVDGSYPLDADRPMTTYETAADGSAYFLLDMGPTLTASASGAPADLIARLDEVAVQMWFFADHIIIDSTDYAVLAETNPSYPLGPFEPGVGEIDLTAMGARAGDDLVALLAPSAVVNPASLAVTLPASLEGVEQDPDDPSLFRATVTYAHLLASQGVDAEVQARSVAIGIAPAVGGDVDGIAAVYLELYENTPTDVEFRIADGILAEMSAIADLSGLYELLFADESFLAREATDAELAEAREMFVGAELIVESVTTFELDDSIVVTPPDGPFDDRTQIAIDWFSQILTD